MLSRRNERMLNFPRLPPPPHSGEILLKAIMFVRKLVLRHLLPPRPYFLRRVYNAEKPDAVTGRYQIARWQVHPWYHRTSAMDRWGPRAWLWWSSGSIKVDLRDPKFMPQGYQIRDVGPAGEVGNGRSFMKEAVINLQAKDPARCPFSV